MFALGCYSRADSRCERVCKREDECAEQLLVEHDRAECVEECTNLVRDSTFQAVVDRHVKCVDKAPSCQAVLNCE